MQVAEGDTGMVASRRSKGVGELGILVVAVLNVPGDVEGGAVPCAFLHLSACTHGHSSPGNSLTPFERWIHWCTLFDESMLSNELQHS